MDETFNRQSNWSINGVDIVLSQTRVYHNGLQQARIRFWVQVMRGGDYVRLSDRERKSIALFDYDSRGNRIPFSDGSPNYRGWSAQDTYRGYSYHPGASSGSDFDRQAVEPAQGGEWFEFYVSAAQNASVRLSFTIRGDDGSTWSTTGYMTPSEGDPERYLAHLDVRENIEVTSEPPLFYSPDNFQLDRKRIIGIHPVRRRVTEPHETSAAIFNDRVTISIVAAGGRRVGIRDMCCTPAGMIHWQFNVADISNPCFTGYARPGETEVHWNPKVPKGAHPLPELAAPESSSGVIVLCGRNDIRRGDHIDPPRGPIAMTITDEYGTLHNRHLDFIAGERDQLKVV